MKVALAVALAAIALPVAHAASVRPALRVASERPIVVRGTSFHPSERVVVRVWVEDGRHRTTVRASGGGQLLARFRASAGTCGVLAVSARGDRGSAAAWTAPPRACGSELGPPVAP